ncbi:TPA: colicin E3/pyocin S6 family cytotoxin [Enterobacter kobei]
MTKRLAKMGDKTSYGKIVSATSGCIDGVDHLVLDGDKAFCNQCKGSFPIQGSASGWLNPGAKCHVAHCDKVLCKCPDNYVFASSNFFTGGAGSQSASNVHSGLTSVLQELAKSSVSTITPVYAKSRQRGEGCTDAGTDQESVDNFGYAGYFRASPQPEQTESEPVQHAQAAKKLKPAEPTPPPEDNRAWYKRLFSSSDAPKASATAGMATARAATTAGIATDAAIEAGYAAVQKIGGNLSTAGRWIAPSPPTVFLFCMFYSPKLNSGEQDYINKMRLEQAARNKEDVPTRVRFRWEADQFGIMRPKGFHVSAGGGQDRVPVRMLHKNTTTGNYEFWEDGADKPIVVWTPDDPGYSSPTNTGSQDNVYIPPNVLVYPESEINSPWSTVTPAPGERSFRDYILVHPAGTFDPIYVYLNADHKYHTAPKGTPPLPAFPDAKRAPRKTAIQGGGQLRARWKDAKGKIYEWDSQHGTVEVYDRSGRNHLGEFNHITGEQTKPADPTRKVEK